MWTKVPNVEWRIKVFSRKLIFFLEVTEAMKSSLRTLNLVASLVLFGIHTPLLFLARGEFTDGVLQTVYFDTPLYVCAQGDSPARYVPPLFPALLYFSSRMGMDPLLAGRLISLVAYAACAFVIGWIGALIGRSLASKCVSDLDPATLDFSSAFVGITAWSFWALSPMANRWAIHCMTDMLFCFLSTTSLACFVASTFRDQRRRNGFWFAGNLWGIAAAWTRYQGLALIAASVFSRILVRKRKRGAPAPPGVEASAFRHSATRKETRVFPAIALLFLWGGTLWLLRSGTGIHQGQFADRAIYPWKLYLDFALAAFQYLPYAVTPPLLLLAMYGIYTAARSGPVAAFWILAGVAGGGGRPGRPDFLPFFSVSVWPSAASVGVCACGSRCCLPTQMVAHRGLCDCDPVVGWNVLRRPFLSTQNFFRYRSRRAPSSRKPRSRSQGVGM